MTAELSKIMEAAAKQDLKGRLGSPRKQAPADSSAGVSLSGLTETSLERGRRDDSIQLAGRVRGKRGRDALRFYFPGCHYDIGPPFLGTSNSL